jgi:hypothetical protein
MTLQLRGFLRFSLRELFSYFEEDENNVGLGAAVGLSTVRVGNSPRDWRTFRRQRFSDYACAQSSLGARMQLVRPEGLYVQFRERREWKGGVRVAYRVYLRSRSPSLRWDQAAKFEQASCFNLGKRSDTHCVVRTRPGSFSSSNIGGS